MARYLSASEAASLVLENTFTDSGDESEIEEDPDFPLPNADEDAEPDLADAEQPHLPLAPPSPQPLPSSECTLSVELDRESQPATLTLGVRDDGENGKL